MENLALEPVAERKVRLTKLVNNAPKCVVYIRGIGELSVSKKEVLEKIDSDMLFSADITIQQNGSFCIYERGL